MQEGLLLKISLICSLIGVLALFFLSENIKLDEASIDDISRLKEGNDVKIKGFVNKITDLDKMAILDVAQLKSVPVVLFKSGNLTISEGDYIEVTGEIQEYEGKMELIGNEIRKLD